MTKCHLSYPRIKLPSKLHIARSVLLKRSRSLAGLVPGIPTLSIDMRDRPPSQHQVRQVKLSKSKRRNSTSIPQTSSAWVSWTCGGDLEPCGHHSRVRNNRYA